MSAIRQDGHPVIAAHLQTTFSALGIEVPTVGPGGLIAAPGDDLELLAQLDVERMVGSAVFGRLGLGQATTWIKSAAGSESTSRRPQPEESDHDDFF